MRSQTMNKLLLIALLFFDLPLWAEEDLQQKINQLDKATQVFLKNQKEISDDLDKKYQSLKNDLDQFDKMKLDHRRYLQASKVWREVFLFNQEINRQVINELPQEDIIEDLAGQSELSTQQREKISELKQLSLEYKDQSLERAAK